MEDIKKNAWLLSIIAVLLALKFVIVPIMEWQDTKLAEIRLLANKKQKIDRVLAQEESNSQAIEKLAVLVEQGNAYIWPYKNESVFKLKMQKFLQEQLIKHDLIMINIGVEQRVGLGNSREVQYPVKVQFKGRTANVISFLMSLESNSQRLSLENFNFSLKGQGEAELGNANGNVLVMFYALQDRMPSGATG